MSTLSDKTLKQFKGRSDIHAANVQAKEDWDEEQGRLSNRAWLTDLLSFGAQFAFPLLGKGIFGAGKVLDFFTGSPLRKALSSYIPKLATNYLMTSLTKPGEYESPNVFGDAAYEDIRGMSGDWKSQRNEMALTSFLKDTIMSQLTNPLTRTKANPQGTKYGTFSEQLGVEPLQFGKNAPLSGSDWVEKFPVDASVLPADYTPPVGVDVNLLPKATGVSTAGALGEIGTAKPILSRFPSSQSAPKVSLGPIPTSLGNIPDISDFFRRLALEDTERSRHISRFQQTPLNVELQTIKDMLLNN